MAGKTQELSGRAYPHTEMMNFQKFYHMLLQSRRQTLVYKTPTNQPKKPAKWDLPDVDSLQVL